MIRKQNNTFIDKLTHLKTKKSREVSTNGRNKVTTLMQAFNANYPYISIYVGTKKERKFYHCQSASHKR